MKYLRDIAEREAINRYTTAQITVEQHNENHISKDTDLDGIMEAWTADFAEKLDISGEMELEVTKESFVSLIVLKGQAKLSGPENTVEATAGESIFVPAGTGRLTVSGTCSIIKTTV